MDSRQGLVCSVASCSASWVTCNDMPTAGAEFRVTTLLDLFISKMITDGAYSSCFPIALLGYCLRRDVRLSYFEGSTVSSKNNVCCSAFSDIWQGNRRLSSVACIFAIGLFLLGSFACSSADEDAEQDDPNQQELDAGGLEDASQQEDASQEPDADEELQPAQLTITITDLGDAPISDALVDLGDWGIGETDEDGLVVFEELMVEEVERVTGRVRAEGFAPRTIVTELEPEQMMSVEAVLVERSVEENVDATSPAVVHATHSSISIQPAASGAFVDESGDPVEGEVTVALTELDPTGEDQGALPGPMVAEEEGSDAKILETFAMMNVEFFKNGEPIFLSPDSSATLEFDLPESVQGEFSVGEELDAYWFDEDAGYWRHDAVGYVVESSASEDRLAWSAEVTHFTWWAAGFAGDPIECWQSNDCVDDETCFGNSCVLFCSFDDDCYDGEICSSGICMELQCGPGEVFNPITEQCE